MQDRKNLNRVLKKEIHNQIKILWQKGLRHSEIAQVLGLNKATSVRYVINILRKKGIKRVNGNKGERHNTHKLSEAQAIEVIKLRGLGHTYCEISNVFNIEQSTARKICSGQSWAHLKRE